jgi:hypothetical protein
LVLWSLGAMVAWCYGRLGYRTDDEMVQKYMARFFEDVVAQAPLDIDSYTIIQDFSNFSGDNYKVD